MIKPLLSLAVRARRDLLFARQQVRQLCRLLGFDPLTQAKIACTFFELAWGEWQGHGPCRFLAGVEGNRLCVYAGPEAAPVKVGKPALRLATTIPLPVSALALDEIVWALQQLRRRKPTRLFEEVRQQNNDLLQVLLKLQQLQQQSDPQVPPKTSACAA